MVLPAASVLHESTSWGLSLVMVRQLSSPANVAGFEFSVHVATTLPLFSGAFPLSESVHVAAGAVCFVSAAGVCVAGAIVPGGITHAPFLHSVGQRMTVSVTTSFFPTAHALSTRTVMPDACGRHWSSRVWRRPAEST